MYCLYPVRTEQAFLSTLTEKYMTVTKVYNGKAFVYAQIERPKKYVFTEEHKEAIKEGKKRSNRSNSKRVICVDTGQVFDSITEASEEMNVGWTTIKNSMLSGLPVHSGRGEGLSFAEVVDA